MIIGENFAFIHTPKSGGMSFTRWLINNVDGRLWVVVPESAFEHSKDSALYEDILPRIQLIKGIRHETLPEARHLINQLGCPEPEFVFSAIRDPYDLLRSYFNYLRKPHIVERRIHGDPDLELALNSEFGTFVKKCNFFSRDENEILDYYTHPKSFKKVDAVPLELMSNYLRFKFSSHRNFGRYNLEVRNATSKPKIDSLEEKRIRKQIYARFGDLLNLYKAAHVQAETMKKWDIDIELNKNIEKAKKRSKSKALELAEKHIEQQRKELENRDLQISLQRQILSKTEESHNDAMTKLRENRKKALVTRDKLIERLRAERDRRGEVVKRRDTEIEKLKTKLSSRKGWAFKPKL